MFSSSTKLSILQLKSSLYEIAVSYAGVRLKNSTGIFLSFEKIVNDFYDNRTTRSAVDYLRQNHQLARCERTLTSQISPTGHKVDKFVNNFLVSTVFFVFQIATRSVLP